MSGQRHCVPLIIVVSLIVLMLFILIAIAPALAVMALVAAALAAWFAAFSPACITAVATEVLPKRVREDVQALHRCDRIIAVNDQFTCFRILLGRSILNHDL